MKNPDGPSENDMEDIPEEIPDDVQAELDEEFRGLSNLSSEELRSRLERLRRERREISDRLVEVDPTTEAYKGFSEALNAASQKYKETESLLSRLQPGQKSRQTGITSITIENLKGISAPVTIPLRPITLLFGANSAGKSTILHAIHYARELLERNNANPDRALHGGEAIELGGFRNLVHKHDLNRAIRIRIEIIPSDDGVPTLEELASVNHWMHLFDVPERESSQEHLNINSQVHSVALELAAQWDFDHEEGWFSECQYLLNGKAIVTIRKAKPEALPVIEKIDYFHPVFQALDESLVDMKTLCGHEMDRFRSEMVIDLFGLLSSPASTERLKFSFDVAHSDTGEIIVKRGDTIDRETVTRLVSGLPNIICVPSADDLLPPGREKIEQAVSRFEEMEHAVLAGCGFFPQTPLMGQVSPAPTSAQPLPCLPADIGSEGEPYWATINQIVLGITGLVREQLDGFRYIGPIRAIPDRYHESPQIEEPERWANGLGAWDCLLRHYDRTQGTGDDFVNEISRWFEHEERLGLGYRIEVTGMRSVAENSPVMNHLKLLQTQYDERNQHDFRENIMNPLQSAPQTPRIRIIDIRTGTEVGPKDIGIGVAQALPIVVAALDSKKPFLAVEQPELHLHPAAQARLGDVFVTQAKRDRLFLIETHSETLMLRIFRRIRETSRNKLPRKELEFTKDDVTLLFVAANEKGTQIKPIRLDDQGKFADPVPGGFFEEGFGELF
jgi:hypothetical protein